MYIPKVKELKFNNTLNEKKCLLTFFKKIRFLITVISCPMSHWLEVSREVDIS